MSFGERFGVAIGFIVVCDLIWISVNVKKNWGIYFEVKNTFEIKNTSEVTYTSKKIGLLFFNAIICWVASALYIAGHTYDDVGTAFGEGAWLGSLVYAVFNLTTSVVAPNWRAHGFFLPIVDTMWGTILFGSASAFVSAVS
jgi:uncharacterized membrane protein